MGKRKERRHAAMSAAGRRVKLDLFAEPSGDLGGSSAQDEVGGDIDTKHHAGLPNSPSSSGIFFLLGQQPENPLLLLGQYSDDELDEELSKKVECTTADNSLDLHGQVEDKKGDVEINAGEDVVIPKVEQHDMEIGFAKLETVQKLEADDVREVDASGSGDSCKDDLTEQTSGPSHSDAELVGDVNSGWKMVLHEESNQYYYWNTVTGDTSWEVPDVLALETELSCEQKTVSDTQRSESAFVGTYESVTDLGVGLVDSIATQTIDCPESSNLPKNIYEHGPHMETWNEGCENEISDDKNGGSDVKRTNGINSSGNALYHENSSAKDHASSRQSGDTVLLNGSSAGVDSEMYMHTIVHEELETGTSLSSRLVKYGEYLLERLKSLIGSKEHLQGNGQVSKYILEVEIRLSDMKSLLSYGSSLVPFWVHSERKLKQLEGIINEEVPYFYRSAQMSEVEGTHKSCENLSIDVKADGCEKKVACYTSENSHSSDVITTEVSKDLRIEDTNYDAIRTEPVSSIGYTNIDPGSSAGGKNEVDGVACSTELTPKTVLHVGEDVDMDVDMEVDDAVPASNTALASGGEYCSTPEPPIQLIPPAEHVSFVPEEGIVAPPLPEEDWIPPPPPDNEPIPPPPPDEPPEPLYPMPPSFSEAVPPLSYTQQYSLSYPGSSFEYYGQAHGEVPGSNFYGHAEGCQLSVLHPTLYYEAVPSTYALAAPVVVNPVEPVAYYSLQEPLPVVTSVESSGFHTESGMETVGSQISSVEANTGTSSIPLPNTKVHVSASDEQTQKASLDAPFITTTIEAPPSSALTESVPASSTAAAVAATSTVAKVQSKVSRNKKRTVAVAPTLRSNKKVSSLVDKWKAAKEELHEDEEEEPENAYEILERKRQREIEEWRAQQIASGEAKANANFMPLGGDWRERVKRRRAQLSGEAVRIPAEGLTDGNKQPDLNELSRDLPSGWQAYWDETSKQVYYGNSVTSETTWIRPTN